MRDERHMTDESDGEAAASSAFQAKILAEIAAMNAADPVHTFWDGMAQSHGESQRATAPDQHYRSLEIKWIGEKLRDGDDVLDVGCGNGYSTFEFAAANPNSRFVGVDYSEPMICHAQARLKREGLKRMAFVTADVRRLSDDLSRAPFRHYDCVVSERCLINLPDWDSQRGAIMQMAAQLKEGGRLVLVENVTEGLDRLNLLRAGLELPPITVRWHNRYLRMSEIEPFLTREFVIESAENIGNLYYIISRVVYAKLAQMDNKEPDYLNPINEIAAGLPALSSYCYSPNMMWVLRRR